MPSYVPSLQKSRDESIFFLGASKTGVVFHKHSDTWNGVVYGNKRWFLYPSHNTPPGGELTINVLCLRVFQMHTYTQTHTHIHTHTISKGPGPKSNYF